MLAPGVQCAAVVKADAYGLGMERVAQALAAAGCTRFFVATLDEGLALRQLLPRAEIAILNSIPHAATGEVAAARLVPVLNDLGAVAAWQASARVDPTAAPAILHLDTGMSRLGLSPAEVAVLAADPARIEGFPLAAVLSHLACSDTPADPMNGEQLARFRAAIARLPRARASLAASSGIFLGPNFHFDLVRPGAALYGVNPLPGTPNPMAQVIHLKARILQVREIDSGDTVGYGATHRMDRPGRIATLAIGYADGWLRSASDRGSAYLAGNPAPILGRISMDLMTIDVTGIDPTLAMPGQFADLLNSSHGIDEAGASAGTIGYEVLTSLGRRLRRVYHGGGSG